VARRKAEGDSLVQSKRLPYAVLLTADGQFDERTVKTIKYKDTAGQIQSVQTRGTRKVPMELQVVAETEEKVDRYLGDVVRNLPRTWVLGQFAGTINILTEHLDDYSSNYQDRAMMSVFVMFTMEIGADPVPVPMLGGATVQPA
jgi:hypothetical protein